MRRWEYWSFHVANGLVAATGLVYGWMRYVLRPTDDFAVVNHPWQPHALHLHILVAPLLVAVIGHFAYRHAWTYWHRGNQEGRRTGVTIALLAAPMILSGYLLQVSVADWARNLWMWAHLVASCTWLAIALTHVAIHILSRRRRAQGPA
jgi:hypothetical protein